MGDLTTTACRGAAMQVRALVALANVTLLHNSPRPGTRTASVQSGTIHTPLERNQSVVMGGQRRLRTGSPVPSRYE